LNKLIFILLILLFSFSISGAEINKKEEVVKRTIMILPFVNTNNVAQYGYISDALRDALRSKLIEVENFQLSNFSLIDDKIKELNFQKNDLVEEKNGRSIALRVKADVIIVGKYIIIDEKIMIQMNAFDIFSTEIIASTSVSGELGLDVFRIIDESVLDMVKKLKTKLKEVKKTYFTEMTNLLIKERMLKFKENFTPVNKAGLGLTAGGGALFAGGLGIFIFDLSYYYSKVKDNLYNNPRTDAGYDEYVKVYQIYSALMISGLVTLGVGTSLVATGIPLLVYKKKNKKVSFNINKNKSLSVEVSFEM
jgi:TolB-like protein